MEKIKVMSVFGTRPEAIKMAPLVKALEKEEKTESIVCVTAQHREMLDQVLRDFNIVPDYDLNIMKAGQTLEDITVRALQGIGEVIRNVKPDIVLVHGDTSTFVPNERIFLNGETDFAGMLVERFAGFHRQSYGGCKVGVGDVLIGASALAAQYNGADKASNVKDKLIEMVHLNESIYSCGIACSAEAAGLH